MAETLRTIASSTTKLRELLKDSKKDLHRIRLLLDALDDGLKSLWPFDGTAEISESLPPPPSLGNGAHLTLESTATDDMNGESLARPAGPGAVRQLIADQAMWKTALALIASGRIVGVVAQADEALAQGSSGAVRERLWIGDGAKYVRWLGRGVVWITSGMEKAADTANLSESTQNGAAQLLAKGMGVGYPDEIVDEVTRLMILEQATPYSRYYQLIENLTTWEQRQFVSALLRYLAKLLNRQATFTDSSNAKSVKTRKNEAVSGAAALIQSILTVIPSLATALTDFLATHPQSIPLARAVLAALPPSTHPEVLKRAWSQFADKLHIQHTAILSQEANVCVLLLAAGYVHRSNPTAFHELARGSTHNSAISERLKSSSERVRWLGMCVGMAISSLVDEGGKKMDFGVDEMNTDDAKALRALVELRDNIGNADDLSRLFAKQAPKNDKGKAKAISRGNADNPKKKATLTTPSNAQAHASKPGIIEVVDDSNGDDVEDDDLIPYAKPDSDEPDSDEDATLANRDKPEAPVYIRDLISNLSDTSNAPLHELALRSAAPLIRRKATFGSELHDRTDELAQCLVSLQDEFDTDGWHELRQAALIALIIAQPKIMGPWLARTLFEGDLSIAQRVAVVTAMGLGGRELAGFKADDDGQMVKVDAETAANAKKKEESWPTKKLGGRLHELYSGNAVTDTKSTKMDLQLKLEAQKVESLTRKMEQVMLTPVSTKERARPRPRKRMLKNDLAALVADYFFFPLTRYWQVYSQASARSNNPLQHPILVSLALKTLSILLTAAGPATTSLPQLTKELFNLLLSLRSSAMRHPPIMEAVLFSLLTVLDVHSGETLSAEMSGLRWLAEECGGPLVEFREWVGLVWERLGGSSGNMKLKLDVGNAADAGGAGDEETQRCKMLAASVLVKIGEIVTTYQRLMVGELSRV